MQKHVATALPAGNAITSRGRTIATLVVLLAFFMDVLDATIVNVAIPSIRDGLGASYSAIQWIIAGYSLAFAVFLITGGRLGDIFGYKKLFLIGMAGFTVASLLSGLATTTEMLVGARLMQGLMAAIMVPQILSTIQILYTTTRERQNVSAFYGGLAGIATVLGPVLGALLITGDAFGLGWRNIFLVNIPVGIAAMILAWLYLPEARSPHPLKLDLVGVALILVAMLMLMFPLIQGRELDWPAWLLVMLAASFPVFALFAWDQVAKDRRDGSPLVAPGLFRQRSFAAGIALSLAFFAIVFGFFFIFTIFLQIGLGYSILKAGLTGIPFSLGVALSAGTSGPLLVPRFGRNIVSAGPIVMGVGYLLFIWTIRHYGAEVTPWEMIPSLVIAGLGMGCVVAPIFPFMLAEVPIKDAGSASGVINAIQQVGGAVGVAVVGVVFFGLLGSEAETSVASVRTELAADLTAAGVPESSQSQVIEGFEACFRDRANAKDLLAVPESCRAGEERIASFAAMQPTIATKVGDALTARGVEANQRNFATAMETTLIYQMGGLVLIFLLTLLLPAKPRSREEMEEIGGLIV
ncbi:MAG: DHA2 family efflux MFS transporter permease subunit [Propylenella sp.]